VNHIHIHGVPVATRRDSLAIAPRQARGRAAQERLVAATLALLAERPFERVSVADIAARAGVAVGSVYRRFPSKERLLVYVAGEAIPPEELAAFHDRLDPARWRGAPVAAVVECYLALTVEVFRRHRTIMRPLALLARLSDDAELRAYLTEVNREAHGRFRALLHERLAAVRHPRPALAIDLALLWASAAIREVVLFGQPVSALAPELDDAALVRELTCGFVAYLGAPCDGR
jgi:AcrR family transcriptional regulator